MRPTRFLRWLTIAAAGLIGIIFFKSYSVAIPARVISVGNGSEATLITARNDIVTADFPSEENAGQQIDQARSGGRKVGALFLVRYTGVIRSGHPLVEVQASKSGS